MIAEIDRVYVPILSQRRPRSSVRISIVESAIIRYSGNSKFWSNTPKAYTEKHEAGFTSTVGSDRLKVVFKATS